MIQASKDIEIDKNNIVHILNKFKNIKVPYYTLIGNHELKSVDSNKEIINLIGYENATFFKDVGEYHLVFLGTDINEDDEVPDGIYVIVEINGENIIPHNYQAKSLLIMGGIL